MRRLTVIVILLGLALAGCAAALMTQQDRQRAQRLTEMQTLADRATAAYGMPPVRLEIANLPDGWAARYWAAYALIEISPGTLDLPRWYSDKVLAHELGHYVLRHPAPPKVQQELEADAEAVKILQRGLGVSEVAAFRTVFEHFCFLERQPAKSQPPGHLSPKEKMADLKRRYPAQADATCPARR